MTVPSHSRPNYMFRLIIYMRTRNSRRIPAPGAKLLELNCPFPSGESAAAMSKQSVHRVLGTWDARGFAFAAVVVVVVATIRFPVVVAAGVVAALFAAADEAKA